MMFKNEDIIKVCEGAFSNFKGTGLYIGLFLMSILYVIICMKKEDRKENKIRIVLGIYCLIILILNLSPFFANFITSILKEKDTYWRVYWNLPIGIGMAFCFTEIIFKKEKWYEQMLIAIIIVFIIILSGNYMYNLEESSEKFVKVNNYYKVPDNVLDIIQYISKEKEEYKKLAGEEVFLAYTRQIDGNILLPEGRNALDVYDNDSITNIIKKGSLKEICDYCSEYYCNYLVLDKEVEVPREYLLGYDIKKIYENKEYSLYKFNRILGQNN